MAQKNLLPYILLGLLESDNKTGYDLKKEFDTEVGEFWSAKHNQLYLELKRMEQDSLITSKTGYFGNKIEKTYYQITDKGREMLDKWRSSSQDELVVSKDEFILKLYFLHDKNDPRIIRMLERQLESKQIKYQHLLDRRELLFNNEDSIKDNYGHFLILEHAISREKEYIDWLNKAIKEVTG